MVSQQFMLVRSDEERFTTPEEFGADEKLLIGSQTGTTNFYVAVYEVLDSDEANPRIKLFENFGVAVQALLSDDVDMVLMDAASSRGYVGTISGAISGAYCWREFGHEKFLPEEHNGICGRTITRSRPVEPNVRFAWRMTR